MQRKENLKMSSCVSQYTLHTIIYSIITPRHIKINQLDHTALHNMGAHPGFQNWGNKGIPIKPKLSWDIELSQVYLFVIVYCIYTPTGKRKDLWETHVKRPRLLKCLGAYMSISLVLYLSRALTSGKDWEKR